MIIFLLKINTLYLELEHIISCYFYSLNLLFRSPFCWYKFCIPQEIFFSMFQLIYIISLGKWSLVSVSCKVVQIYSNASDFHKNADNRFGCQNILSSCSSCLTTQKLVTPSRCPCFAACEQGKFILHHLKNREIKTFHLGVWTPSNVSKTHQLSPTTGQFV